MPVVPFAPKYMKIGVLTAALQELTPRAVRDPDPDRAIEDWVGLRPRGGRRLHPALGRAAPERVPTCRPRPCSIRWPTPSTCASPSTRTRAKRVQAALEAHTRSASRTSATSTTCSTTTRRSGRRSTTSCARDRRRRPPRGRRGVRLRRPQPGALDGPEPRRTSRRASCRCSRTRRSAGSPTASSSARCRAGPRRTTGTTTSPTRRGTWIALHRICEKHGVGDQFRIHYDPSHAILMGQDTRSLFQYLKDEGYDFLIGGFHVKGQVIDAKGVVGLGLRRPDRGARRLEGRQALAQPGRPGERLEEADRALRARAARAPRSTTRSPTCRTARWTGSTTSSRRASC